MEVRYCKNCGTAISNDEAFCGICGSHNNFGLTNLPTLGNGLSNATALPNDLPDYSTQAALTDTRPVLTANQITERLHVVASIPHLPILKEKRKSKRKLFLIVGFILLLVIGSVVSAVLYQSHLDYETSAYGTLSRYCHNIASPTGHEDAYKILSDQHTNRSDISKAQFMAKIQKEDIKDCSVTSSNLSGPYQDYAQVDYTYNNAPPSTNFYLLFKRSSDDTWKIDTSYGFFTGY